MMSVFSSTSRTAVMAPRGISVLFVVILLMGLFGFCVTGCRSVAHDAGGAASNAMNQQNQREQRIKDENDVINSSSSVGKN